MSKERAEKIQSIHDHFREIISLENLLLEEKIKVQEQINREELLTKQVTLKREELGEKEKALKGLKDKSNELEKELFDVDKKLESISSQMNNVSDNQTLENIKLNQKNFEIKKDKLENELLEKIEFQETLEDEISELQEFDKNIEKTLKDLGSEIDSLKASANTEIKNYRKRILGILDQLKSEGHGDFDSKYQNFKDKQLAAFYTGDKCSKCGMKLSGVALNTLKDLTELVSCPGCKRYLIFQPS